MARNLIENNEMWKKTIEEAFGERSGPKRRYIWLAVLFGSVQIPHLNELLDEILENRNHYLVPRHLQTEPLDVRRQFALERIEVMMRINGFAVGDDGTCCSYVGLDPPRNIPIGENDIVQV